MDQRSVCYGSSLLESFQIAVYHFVLYSFQLKKIIPLPLPSLLLQVTFTQPGSQLLRIFTPIVTAQSEGSFVLICL